MARDHPDIEFDRELEDLPPELRWREWMRRIEAVLFASGTSVPALDLAKVVGQGASVEMLIEDLAVELTNRPYEIARASDSWMLRTRPAYAPAIRIAADLGDQELDQRELDVSVLAAIAYHPRGPERHLRQGDQPRPHRTAARAGLFTTVSRAPPRRTLYLGPHRQFLVAFNLQTLRDLPDKEQLKDAGIAGAGEPHAYPA